MARYSKKIVEDICTLVKKDSYTVAEICKLVGIAESTYYTWKAKKTEFQEAIAKAQDIFNEMIVAEAKRSLLKQIRGYSAIETRTVTADTGKKNEDGNPIVKVKEHTKIEKHIQPNVAATIFALTNRDPDNWKNRVENNMSADISLKSELENCSDEELETIIKNGKIESDKTQK